MSPSWPKKNFWEFVPGNYIISSSSDYRMMKVFDVCLKVLRFCCLHVRIGVQIQRVCVCVLCACTERKRERERERERENIGFSLCRCIDVEIKCVLGCMCVCVCVCACVRACVRASVYACMRACACACLGEWFSMCEGGGCQMEMSADSDPTCVCAHGEGAGGS